MVKGKVSDIAPNNPKTGEEPEIEVDADSDDVEKPKVKYRKSFAERLINTVLCR